MRNEFDGLGYQWQYIIINGQVNHFVQLEPSSLIKPAVTVQIERLVIGLCQIEGDDLADLAFLRV